MARYADSIGVSYHSLRRYRDVSKAYENASRVANVSWTHHRLVAARPDRLEWLRRAADAGWPVYGNPSLHSALNDHDTRLKQEDRNQRLKQVAYRAEEFLVNNEKDQVGPYEALLSPSVLVEEINRLKKGTVSGDVLNMLDDLERRLYSRDGPQVHSRVQSTDVSPEGEKESRDYQKFVVAEIGLAGLLAKWFSR